MGNSAFTPMPILIPPLPVPPTLSPLEIARMENAQLEQQISSDNIANGANSAKLAAAQTAYSQTNDVYVTGGTYSSGTALFTNNTGGTFNVTGFLIKSSLFGSLFAIEKDP